VRSSIYCRISGCLADLRKAYSPYAYAKSPHWSIAHEIQFATQADVFKGDVDKKIEAAKGVIKSL
ncbi:hypothetical protein AOA59_24110, partial [Pseudomonas sp. 2822-15]|uniref:hypothetical protein n=1 Tax=Pseudomonas sp. 2822-15 TaxID=1712677 RepID=UPI000C3CABBB